MTMLDVETGSIVRVTEDDIPAGSPLGGWLRKGELLIVSDVDTSRRLCVSYLLPSGYSQFLYPEQIELVGKAYNYHGG